MYKLLVYRPLAANPLFSKRALQIANTSGAVCNLMCIMILSRVYEKVAQSLTHWGKVNFFLLAYITNIHTMDIYDRYTN